MPSRSRRCGRPAEGREARLRQLADEPAALRRVATLVARAVPAPELFAAVAVEVRRVLGADVTRLLGYERDGTATGVPDGERFAPEGENVSETVLRTGRPARIDAYEGASGSIAARLREDGIRSSVGARSSSRTASGA